MDKSKIIEMPIKNGNGRLDNEFALLTESINKNPENAELRRKLAVHYYNNLDPHNALMCYQQALDLNPNDELSLFGLALCQKELAYDTETIKKSFEKCIQLDPTEPEFHLEYGNYLYSLMGLEETLALKEYKEFLRLADTREGFDIYEIKTVEDRIKQIRSMNKLKMKKEFERGRIESAIKRGLKILEYDPGDPDLPREIATFFFFRGDYKESLNFFLKSLNIKPNSYLSALGIAVCKFKIGGDYLFKDVKKDYEKAIKMNPNYPVSHLEYAKFLDYYYYRTLASMEYEKFIRLAEEQNLFPEEVLESRQRLIELIPYDKRPTIVRKKNT